MFPPRILDPEPVATLADHRAAGGGRGLDAARRLGPIGIIDHVEAAGLRGRGGAGFSTGRKWRTVAESLSASVPPTVVVNAAEGEPGTFKDRAIIRANPYKVLEGALVAATAIGADRVVLAMKASFATEVARMEAAIAEVTGAGWTEGVELAVVQGPSHYLYGEETALLEVLAGRQPFPRIAPPFRHGIEEIGGDTVSAAEVTMASEANPTPAPPTLVNNAETLANVPGILAEGPDWYRSVGTPESPGTIVCTITGRTQRHGVGEFPMGTPLRSVIDELGGGALPGARVVAAMSGVANPVLPEDALDTPLTYEDMQAAGAGLGAAGFIVFDDRSDLVAVAAGVSRFLAVESCGQCTPCKQDGRAIAESLDLLRSSRAGDHDLAVVQDKLSTVADGARCYLGIQHQQVVGSVLALFGEQARAHATGALAGAEPELIAPIVDLVEGRALLDEDHRTKQPDWTHDEVDSGQAPADRIDQRAPAAPEA
ncbi:MAG TPA: NADH-ubiquinone oxidoreductase-F iron-sulfur binding region domain-containing protein [Acidimicrobiales bacterium]|nr:NADH-ubiquinone oxidoreductase-F iron-sulfur binding region domain-containing protein [Acidimicrobiales bacterium]